MMNTDKPKMAIDYSTINVKELAKLPVAKLPPTYHLQEGMGNGCALDPPGYPTYFTRSVYTQHGNAPHRGASLVLLGHVVERADWKGGGTWEHRQQEQEKLMKRLYLPLPIDHPRVQEWMKALYRHFLKCYADDSKPKHDPDHIVIYPVPDYKLKSFHDDPRFSNEWREKEKAAVAQANEEIIASAEKLATPKNHLAVRYIKEIYPDFQPISQPEQFLFGRPSLEQLLQHGPIVRSLNWYERFPRKPEPDECPGEAWSREGRHPVNRTWCQVCGWHKAEENANEGQAIA